MGRHRRNESGVLEATAQYERLVLTLQHHRPGKRSGLCLVCGVGWPCVEVRLPIQRQ